MTKRTKPPFISLLVPVYNEHDTIDEFWQAISAAMKGVTTKFEVVFVDDGSSDDTLEVLAKLQKKSKRVRVLKLSRNFGKEAALSAALDHANGDVVVPIDVDLQDPPALIEDMVEKWKDGADVVLATRKSRDEDSWLKRVSAEGFYKLIGKISHVHLPANTGDFRLMDRKVVEVVKQCGERSRFMKGLLSWPGFKTEVVYYDRPARSAGETKWSPRRLLRLALDGIFSFSTVPLQIWTVIGVVVSVIAFLYALLIVFKTIFLGIDVPGYASLMVVVLFLGGIQLISLGVIGEYVARIYREVKGRPLYVIDEVLGEDDGGKK